MIYIYVSNCVNAVVLRGPGIFWLLSFNLQHIFISPANRRRRREEQMPPRHSPIKRTCPTTPRTPQRPAATEGCLSKRCRSRMEPPPHPTMISRGHMRGCAIEDGGVGRTIIEPLSVTTDEKEPIGDWDGRCASNDDLTTSWRYSTKNEDVK